MNLARAVLAASGGLAAFVTLMPAAIAGLIALFDFSAHGLLGMSGTLLGLATPFGGNGSGLATYHGVEVNLPRTAMLSLLRGSAPVGMIVLAAIQPRLRPRSQWAIAAGCGCASMATAGWLAAPGCAAAAILFVKSPAASPRRAFK